MRLIIILGGTKEALGEHEPSQIDATRRRKLSLSLLPRVPRSSQLPKLLCASSTCDGEGL